MIKKLRNQKQLSQEQLADMSQLSLRTIQRIESGHRVSYRSLRSLAQALEVDVDELELELYAKDMAIKDYQDYPFWVRFACGRGWFSASRSELIKIELFAVFFSVFAGLVWSVATVFELPLIDKPFFMFTLGELFLFSAIGCLFCAYNFSIAIRVGDKLQLWDKLAATQPKGLFGLSK